MLPKVKLIKLTKEQSEKAKVINKEPRKTYSYCVLCEGFGQRFGTKIFCEKYYKAWRRIFPLLYSGGESVNFYEIENYEDMPNLVSELLAAHEKLEQKQFDKKFENSVNSSKYKQTMNPLFQFIKKITRS